jgi:hypothetical protein
MCSEWLQGAQVSITTAYRFSHHLLSASFMAQSSTNSTSVTYILATWTTRKSTWVRLAPRSASRWHWSEQDLARKHSFIGIKQFRHWTLILISYSQRAFLLSNLLSASRLCLDFRSGLISWETQVLRQYRIPSLDTIAPPLPQLLQEPFIPSSAGCTLRTVLVSCA